MLEMYRVSLLHSGVAALNYGAQKLCDFHYSFTQLRCHETAEVFLLPILERLRYFPLAQL